MSEWGIERWFSVWVTECVICLHVKYCNISEYMTIYPNICQYIYHHHICTKCLGITGTVWRLQFVINDVLSSCLRQYISLFYLYWVDSINWQIIPLPLSPERSFVRPSNHQFKTGNNLIFRPFVIRHDISSQKWRRITNV